MKKLFALFLCLMMAFSMTAAAVAETADSAAVELLYEGSWVQFEDGFEVYLPVDWVPYEVDEEMLLSGIAYAAGYEDGSMLMTVGWLALEQDMTIEEAQAALAVNDPDAAIVEVNGVGLIGYLDAENNTMNCVALDGTEPGAYVFSFFPGDDEDVQTLAALIATSIRNIP